MLNAGHGCFVHDDDFEYWWDGNMAGHPRKFTPTLELEESISFTPTLELEEAISGPDLKSVCHT